MRVDLSNGLLDEALFLPSPNYNERPLGCAIDLIVIHSISLPAGIFTGNAVIDLFKNQLDFNVDPSFESLRNLKVSSHLWIRREGALVQFVPFHYRAWHAGVSSYKGRENCNDFSIGIELEGTDTSPYLPIQYQQLRFVIKALQVAYPDILPTHIVGHSDIAPGRKTDPGPAFYWEALQEGVCSV